MQRACCLVVGLAAACGGGREPDVVEESSTCEASFSLSSGGVPQADLLFVVDRSGAMAEVQDKLATSFARFMDIAESRTGPASLHIGVIAADLGDGAMLEATARVPGCRPPAKVPYLRSIDHLLGLETNYAGSLAEAFTCIALLGAPGAPAPRALDAVEMARDGRNPGFFRPDARTHVVVVAAEDDASQVAANEFLRGLGDASVAVVAPASALRLQSLVTAQDHPWAAFVDLAEDDLSPVIEPLFRPLIVDHFPVCLPASADLGPSCAVTEAGCVVPRCAEGGDGPRPCWWVRPSSGCAELRVEREDYPAAGTQTVRCAVRCPR
jgi:hypothetical protein